MDERPSLDDKPQRRSSLAERRPSLDERRRSLDDKSERRPSLDERPSLDDKPQRRSSLAERRPSLDERRRSLDDKSQRRPSLAERRPSLDERRPSLDDKSQSRSSQDDKSQGAIKSRIRSMSESLDDNSQGRGFVRSMTQRRSSEASKKTVKESIVVDNRGATPDDKSKGNQFVMLRSQRRAKATIVIVPNSPRLNPDESKSVKSMSRRKPKPLSEESSDDPDGRQSVMAVSETKPKVTICDESIASREDRQFVRTTSQTKPKEIICEESLVSDDPKLIPEDRGMSPTKPKAIICEESLTSDDMALSETKPKAIICEESIVSDDPRNCEEITDDSQFVSAMSETKPKAIICEESMVSDDPKAEITDDSQFVSAMSQMRPNDPGRLQITQVKLEKITEESVVPQSVRPTRRKSPPQHTDFDDVTLFSTPQVSWDRLRPGTPKFSGSLSGYFKDLLGKVRTLSASTTEKPPESKQSSYKRRYSEPPIHLMEEYEDPDCNIPGHDCKSSKKRTNSAGTSTNMYQYPLGGPKKSGEGYHVTNDSESECSFADAQRRIVSGANFADDSMSSFKSALTSRKFDIPRGGKHKSKEFDKPGRMRYSSSERDPDKQSLQRHISSQMYKKDFKFDDSGPSESSLKKSKSPEKFTGSSQTSILKRTHN